MDDLFERLQKRGAVCNIGNYFVGCLAYDDEVTFLAPSINKKALKIIILFCHGYASGHFIFNVPKSQFIIFRGWQCRTENSCFGLAVKITN